MIRLAVRCPADVAELVLAELLELAPNGVEEDRGPGWVEYAIYGAEGELPDLGALGAEAGGARLEVTSATVPDDWADRWRDFHRPTAVAGGRIVVRASWHEAPRGADVDVAIDPGQAFGTGAHPTTRMCLELLLELADAGRARGSLLDLGTGSGVLAIAAARLGWAPVTGLDSERAAVAAAEANARANGVAARFERRDVRAGALPPAATVVANLTAPLLLDAAAALPPAPGTLVCSGLLAGERERVAAALAGAGFERRAERRSGEWAALLLARPGAPAP